MNYLDEALISYSKTDIYPFHMPGHKRRGINFPNPYAIDITEIDGFDNLHCAESILRDAQERAARLYGSDFCYYLVNGSTCGLLAAICAVTKKRDKVLVARNSHKAVYHALFLNELHAEYLYPAITENDLQGQITPEQVADALLKNPDTVAVILTSPTYEGILSDVAGISEICHAKGIPLLVDEAHGAHLGFGEGFPENAVRLGADAVIMSLHKTLPSFTQTALLHLSGGRIDRGAVERYLEIFETSSPSYLFMAGMDACVRALSESGRQLFVDYRRHLEDFYQKTADLQNLHVMQRGDLCQGEAYGWDDSKLVIFGRTPGSGEWLSRTLLQKYQLQMEMVSSFYVLGMTSIMDTEEGFERLAAALREIDATVDVKDAGHRAGFIGRMYTENERRLQIDQAMALPCAEVAFAESRGRVSADYVYLYPPGIPLLVPGEVITGEFLQKIIECRQVGLHVEGQRNLARGRIKIVYF